MKILYIWNGNNTLPESRKNSILNTMSVYPKAEYYCVTNSSSFLSFSNIINLDGEKDKMREFFGIENIPIEWNSNSIFSDWYRFYYLMNNPNTLYLDTDCQMVKYFDFEKMSKIVMANNEICLLYSPTNGIFNSAKAAIDRYLSTKRYLNLLPACLYMKGKLDSFILDDSYYKHK